MRYEVPCPLRKRYLGVLGCPEAWNCDECAVLEAHLDELGGNFMWLCGFCLSNAIEEGLAPQGYYSAGECEACGRDSIALQVTL